MKDLLRKVGLSLSVRTEQLRYYFDFIRWKKIDHTSSVNRQNQILLSFRYREFIHDKCSIPRFDEVEFRCFSQHGEDGILWFLFSLIGTSNKQVVEVCAGDGVECNAANLIINDSWTGLLFDGNKRKIEYGRIYYAHNLNTLQCPPTLVNAWIDAEHVDALITSNGMQGEIDLLSLDMDGVDYWVCRSITSVTPRVIVVEYNAGLGPHESVSVPYRLDFRAENDYWGASLTAFVNLLRQKGYRLVGCERSGINAFFVQSDIAEDILPEVSPEHCFTLTRAGQIYNQRASIISRYEWVPV